MTYVYALTGFQYSGRLQRPRLGGKNAILNRILFGQAAEQKTRINPPALRTRQPGSSFNAQLPRANQAGQGLWEWKGRPIDQKKLEFPGRGLNLILSLFDLQSYS